MKAKDPNITADELRAILDYNPETGEFRWKARTPDMFEDGRYPKERRAAWFNSRNAGRVAGQIYKDGYRMISIWSDRRYMLAHRLAWFYVTGEWPNNQVDHINRDRSDNRFSNLRLTENGPNQVNSIVPKNNTSGFKGVSFHRRRGKYQARIGYNMRRICLGYYETAEEAAAVYDEAALKYFGEFARVNNGN